MRSGPQLRSLTIDRRSGHAFQVLRLTVKPKSAVMGMIDGAWWPRSVDPLAEFPAMIAGIALRIGQADRVAFNNGVWAEAPGKIVVGGRTIELEGFRSLDKDTVLVHGQDWHRMALLVIPPETAEDAAVEALARASDPYNTESAAQILDAVSPIETVRPLAGVH